MRFTSGRQKEHCLENQEVCIGIVLVMELINILLDVVVDLSDSVHVYYVQY